jgi:hypothetical protein
VEVDVSIDSETFLVIDFMDLNIKPVQSFKCAHRSSIYVRVFIGMSAHICMSICVYTVFLKKKLDFGIRRTPQEFVQESRNSLSF